MGECQLSIIRGAIIHRGSAEFLLPFMVLVGPYFWYVWLIRELVVSYARVRRIFKGHPCVSKLLLAVFRVPELIREHVWTTKFFPYSYVPFRRLNECNNVSLGLWRQAIYAKLRGRVIVPSLARYFI